MSFFRYIFILFICLVNISQVYTQDIEQVAKAPIVSTNGGLSLSQIANFSPDTNFNREPYSMYLSGNLNTTLFGVLNLPVSFAYTNNQATSNLPQPFNRLSLTPSYKWITAHIGYSSMTFSPYTLTGHEFMGGGIELAPTESIKFSAMYGRLKKAVEPDSMGMESSYRRMGGGFKIEYLNEKFDLGFNVFKAKDDAGSLEFPEPDSIFVQPQDNIAGSICMNLKLIKNLSVTAEYALSALNNDISQYDSVEQKKNFALHNEGDMAVYHAYKTQVSQKTDIGNIGATYERVSPNYNTLGSYYFTNDFENITANLSTSLMKWLNLSMDAGYQRDNLSEQKVNSSSRLIYSANASARASKKLNLSGGVSNMQTYVHIKDIYNEITQTNEYQNLDTLSFTQLNLAETFNVNYILQSSKEKRQNINAGFTYQEASEQQEDNAKFTGNKIYNSTLAYQFSLIPKRFNASASINHNLNKMPELTLNVFSYNLSLQKTFHEKIKTSLITTFSNTFQESENTMNIMNIRATAGYLLLKKHNFNLSLAMVNKNGAQGKSTQCSINFAYSYAFNFQVKREDGQCRFEGSF